MKKSKTELTYLRAAAQNASAAGLVILLYDLLIADLEGAIAAIAESNIEKRSGEINHAFLVLQQLEGSLDMKNGGDAAKHLSRFYSVIRCRLLEAQIKTSPELIRQQINLIVDVQKAWQQVDTPGSRAESEQASGGRDGQSARAAAASASRGGSSNWTA